MHDRTRPIIALTGYARSGKDTAAQTLIDHGWTRLAFADMLKTLTYAIDPIIDVQNGRNITLGDIVDDLGWEAAKGDPDIRSALQRTGHAIRQVDPSFFIRGVLNKIANTQGPIVVTDARFQNEVDALRASGAHVVRLTRPGVGPLNDHASELEVDLCTPDVTLVNDGDIEGLQHEMLVIADGLSHHLARPAS